MRLLEPTLTITKVAKRRFSYHAPLYWNKLPISIRNLKDTPAFRTALKHTILMQYNLLLVI